MTEKKAHEGQDPLSPIFSGAGRELAYEEADYGSSRSAVRSAPLLLQAVAVECPEAMSELHTLALKFHVPVKHSVTAKLADWELTPEVFARWEIGTQMILTAKEWTIRYRLNADIITRTVASTIDHWACGGSLGQFATAPSIFMSQPADPPSAFMPN